MALPVHVCMWLFCRDEVKTTYRLLPSEAQDLFKLLCDKYHS